jgi:hypothetical protein
MKRETYLGLWSEAGLLVADIDSKLAELQELEACIAEMDRQAAGGSGTRVKAVIAPVVPVFAVKETEFLFKFNADGVKDFDCAEASMTKDDLDPANVDCL